MNSKFTKIVIAAIILMKLIVCCNGDGKNTSRISSKLNSPNPYIIENVHFSNKKDNAQLAGTLTLPNSSGKFTAVVLISGSGLQDRDETAYGHKPFKILADFLTRQNIAVLRYDDRGAGKSTGPLNNVTPENFAEDAYSAVQYLKARNNIDTGKIGLIGHSMGAIEGSILASRYNDIAFLVMLGGPGIPISENMLLSDSINNSLSGKSPGEIRAGQNLIGRMIAEVKKGNNSTITEINLNRIIAEWRDSLPPGVKKQIDEFTKTNPSHWKQMAGEWATPYFKFVLNFDPYPVLNNISCPTLSLIGEKDVQTLPKENSAAIRKSLEYGKCNNYQVEIIKNVNHLFQQCETGTISEYAELEDPFDLAVKVKISNWILGHKP